MAKEGPLSSVLCLLSSVLCPLSSGFWLLTSGQLAVKASTGFNLLTFKAG